MEDPSKLSQEAYLQLVRSPEHQTHRAVVAELMAPFMQAGLDTAISLAHHQGVHNPDERFHLVRAATVMWCQDPLLYVEYLSRHEHYQDRVPDSEQFARLHEYFENLTIAAIDDAHYLSRSAAGLLTAQGRGDTAHCLARSKGLLTLSKVDKDALSEVRAQLGDPIEPQWLAIQTDNAGDTVNFTPEAQAYLARHPARAYGCPASRVDNLLGSEGDTLLHGFWERYCQYAFAAAS